MNERGWYTPVAFAYLSLLFKAADDPSHIQLSRVAPKGAAGAPPAPPTRGMNLIYLHHESMSGAIALGPEEGRAAMPWFQEKMHNDPDFYVFEHVRTGSGITIDALPALTTGCLPYTDEGIAWAHAPGRSIGHDFRDAGYPTASFSSRSLDNTMRSGQWKMLYDVLAGGMDRTVDPIAMGWKNSNAEGDEDRKMLPLFEEWLGTIEDGKTPFYAQFYNFNQHSPYVKDKNNEAYSHRYFDSLRTTDQFLEGLFDILARTGRLENTIVIGSGDHGEDPFKGSYVRLSALDSLVLHANSYLYFPRPLMRDQTVADRLRRNTQQLVHTIDFYPTIKGAFWGNFDYLAQAQHGCITGVDLTAVDVPQDRVALSINYRSSQLASPFKGEFWAVSTKELALYHRKAKNRHPKLNQGKNNYYVLEFGECESSTSKTTLCLHTPKEDDLDYFRGVIGWIKNTQLLGEGVKSSELVNMFAEKVMYNEVAIAADSPTEVSSSSKGFIASMHARPTTPPPTSPPTTRPSKAGKLFKGGKSNPLKRTRTPRP